MKNYIGEIIEEYLKNRYPKETEEKIRYWLADEEYADEKNEALNVYWDLLHVDPDIFVYESLEQVKEKIITSNVLDVQVVLPDYPTDMDISPVPENMLPVVPDISEANKLAGDIVPPIIQLSASDAVPVSTYDNIPAPVIEEQKEYSSLISEVKKDPVVILLRDSEPEEINEEKREDLQTEIIVVEKDNEIEVNKDHELEVQIEEGVEENRVFSDPEPEEKRPAARLEINKPVWAMEDEEEESGKRNFPVWARIAAVLIPLICLIGSYFYLNNDEYQPVTMLYATIPYGEKGHIQLPDGSEVWLNAGSSLSYPERFMKGERRVELNGEAFFSVTKDSKSPFRVETSTITIEVLGTEFNVVAYPEDNKAITTLNSGKIQVQTPSDELYMLEPSQLLDYDNRTRQAVIQVVEDIREPDWKEGHLIFRNSSPEDILRTLERRMNVKFLIEDLVAEKDETYTVKFINNETIEQIMPVLQEMIHFSWKQEDSHILILSP